MKKLVFAGIGLSILLSACSPGSKFTTDNSVSIAGQHLANSLVHHTDTARFPRSENADGSLKAVPSNDWTAGFYPGNLWLMYELTQDEKWAKAAEEWTAGMTKEQFNTRTHDLGFMLFCSFGNGLRLKDIKSYEPILIQGAKSLSSRFNPKIGSIRSWDFQPWQYPVIIDNMMNLELLFWATKVTGDSTFYDIAVTHADTTIKNHFRPDFSSYHVIDYDTLTGDVLAKKTHQGTADHSAWARGQAWGLYGFTATYRETGDKKYLKQAENIAEFYLNHPNLPEDMIPYWDFNAPDIPNEERDASAAAVAASGLLELSTFSDNGEKYFAAAKKMLESLGSPAYLAVPGTNNDFILMHSVGHKPANSEIDKPLVYADYYFLEGLIRYDELKSKH